MASAAGRGASSEALAFWGAGKRDSRHLRTSVYVDGVNFFHGSVRGAPWKWLERMTMARDYKSKVPALEPLHPGTLLRDDVLPRTGLSVDAVAKALGVTRQALHRVLTARRAVTPDMALRLGKLFGNGPEMWLRMQQAHDLREAELRLATELARIRPIHAE